MDDASLQVGARLVGWTLVHFVWQGVLVAALYGLLRAALPRGNARYLLGMFALAALALCPLLTGVALWHEVTEPVRTGTVTTLPTLWIGGGADAIDVDGQPFEAILPWLALAWSCGVVLLSLRAWRQWNRLQALVRVAERLPAWEQRTHRMVRQFGLRRPVAILCSAAIATPALIGWLRPVIVLPVAMLSSFPMAQIEWLLAHELAHLRRWDPLCNLFQLMLETVYFYHPAVHWISRDVRNEREICCDALALSIRGGGDRLDFARALAGLADLREKRASLLLAASGGVLLDRVQRVVAAPPRRRDQMRARPLTMTMGLALAVVVASMVWRSPVMPSLRVDRLAEWSPQRLQAPTWLVVDLVPAQVEAVRLAIDQGASSLAAVPAVIRSMARLTPYAMPLQVTDLAPPSRTRWRLVVPAAVEAAMPVPLRMRQPTYPEDAYERGIEGRVVTEFGIGADGQVQDIRVIHAEPAGVFDLAALRAIRGWQFPSAGAVGSASYRQTMVFSLHPAAGGSSGEAIGARIGCRIVTGTLICRLPEEAKFAGQQNPVVAGALRQ